MMNRIVFFILIVVVAVSTLHSQNFTRGIGVYPGNPNEYRGPVVHIDDTNYRNLALHRPAYHSSSYDYNLTAQLITDGIKETNTPLRKPGFLMPCHVPKHVLIAGGSFKQLENFPP